MDFNEQQKLIMQLSSTIDDFLPATQTPSSSWIYNQSVINICGKNFFLSYLTLYPDLSQSMLEITGNDIISPEQSSPLNLPRMIKSEASILAMFGIKKALTLHPCNNNSIISIFDFQYDILDQNHSQLLTQLFQIAAMKSSLAMNFPFLIFTGSPNLVHVSGRVNNLLLLGTFNPDNVSMKFGVNRGNQFIGAKVLQKMLEDTELTKRKPSGIKTTKVLSQIYSSIPAPEDLSELHTPTTTTNTTRTEETDLSVINLMTILKHQRQAKKPAFLSQLSQDENGNYILSEIEQNNQISVNLSRFSNLKLFQIEAKKLKNQTIVDCWEIFKGLPPNSMRRGTAVESIVCHEFSEVVFDGEDVRKIQKKLEEVMKNKFQETIHNEESEDYEQLENLYYKQLKDLIENIDEIKMIFAEIPTSMSIIAIQNITHFGTAAINSFTEHVLDLDEAMIWAFNFIINNNQVPTLMQANRKVALSFDSQDQLVLPEQSQNLLRDFINRTKFQINIEKFNESEPELKSIYQRGRNCPLGCPLCRFGQILQRLESQYIPLFTKFMLQQFQKGNAFCQQIFDVYQDSIIYQKIYQLFIIKQDQQQQRFTNYIEQTIDQVQVTYQSYSKYKNSFEQLIHIPFIRSVNYLLLVQAKDVQFNDPTFFKLFFESRCQNFNHETINYNESTLVIPKFIEEKYLLSTILPDHAIFYPFSNNFVIQYIIDYLDQIQALQNNDNIILNLKQSIDLDIKKLFMQNQEFFESQVSPQYVAEFCSQQALLWGYSRSIRKLNKYQPEYYKNELRQIDWPVTELNNFLKSGYLNPQMEANMKNIKRVFLIYENIMFIGEKYKLPYEISYSLLTNVTPLDAGDRNLFKQQFNFQFNCWELVLSCVCPEWGKYYRFYSQYVSGETRKNNFLLSFDYPISLGIVDSL